MFSFKCDNDHSLRGRKSLSRNHTEWFIKLSEIWKKKEFMSSLKSFERSLSQFSSLPDWVSSSQVIQDKSNSNLKFLKQAEAKSLKMKIRQSKQLIWSTIFSLNSPHPAVKRREEGTFQNAFLITYRALKIEQLEFSQLHFHNRLWYRQWSCQWCTAHHSPAESAGRSQAFRCQPANIREPTHAPPLFLKCDSPSASMNNQPKKWQLHLGREITFTVESKLKAQGGVTLTYISHKNDFSLPL